MPADVRARLLQRIHDNLDDDLARSVYADHLLELGGSEKWHGELIRLQLDNTAPDRIAKLLRDHQTRALGQLVHLYDVTWTRGFPERLRTRKWSREHVDHVVRSPHLPTIESVEIGYLRAVMLPKLLSAPKELTSRITELNLCAPTQPQLDELIAARSQFPRLRHLGLALEPMEEAPNQLTPASLRKLLESPLGARLEAVQKATTRGMVNRFVKVLDDAPARLQHLELLTVNDSGDAESAIVMTRTANGFEPNLDPLVPMIAMLRADGDAGFESETRAWPKAQLEELAERLADAGLTAEARTVREVASRR